MNNYWPLALTLSLLFHTLIFTRYSFFLNRVSKPETQPLDKKNITKLEIAPEKIEKIIQRRPDDTPAIKPLPYLENFIDKLIQNNSPAAALNKPQIFRENIKEIVFSETEPQESELKKNDAYMSYYRLIREKIKANAYNNYNSKRKGEILVSFLILNDGSLKDVSLNSNLINSKVLERIALKSIKDSSPFPAFPKELRRYSQLRFNISIYFKNN